MLDLERRLASLSPAKRQVLARRLAGISAETSVADPEVGESRLVAYVTFRAGSQLTEVELRRFLQSRLPAYTVPDTFYFVDEMPRLPNGKVDRRALSAIAAPVSPLHREGYVSPRTNTEEILVGLWTQLLSRQEVGVCDDFFSLGGHSLLATQLCSRIRGIFSIELSVRHLFELKTIEKLSRHLDAAGRDEQVDQIPGLQAGPRDGPMSLSSAQKRLWFLDQLEGPSATYNMGAQLDLVGRLDVSALQRSLTEIARRHETLRTTFATHGTDSVQIIAPPTDVPLPLIDLHSIPEEKADAEARRITAAEIREPFDLGRGPVFRLKLLRLRQDSHRLLVTMHHIVSDGWSIGVFVNELAALYESFTGGAAAALPDVTIQYGDFARWQNQCLKSAAVQQHLDYWTSQLDGAGSVALPTDYPRPAIQTYQGDNVVFQIDLRLTQRLERLSRTAGATQFMTLIAAFKILLSRYSGQQDIVVGTPIANRNHSEVEPLIGFFANTLVLRTQLDGEASFLDVLGRVREVALDAYAHQDLPFERLVEVVNPERHLSYAPLFQAMFILQNPPTRELRLSDLSVTVSDLLNETAKFDIILSIEETPQGLRGELEYSTSLFEETTIQRMVAHFRALLESIVADPEQGIANLSLVTTEEQQQLSEFCAAPSDPRPRDTVVHQLWEDQVARTPDAVAVVFEDQQLTYEALNARANQVAHYLSRLGVGPESRVGLCLERSLPMVVGLLGIMKAGAAYVPLDPTYPRDRLRFMIEDAQTAVLLTTKTLGGEFSDGLSHVVCLDTDGERIARESRSNLNRAVRSSNLAYVIYTSGSSGRPKGVAMPHVALANLLRWQSDQGLRRPAARTLQFASLSFDVAFQECFSTWCTGGTIVLVPESRRKDMEALSDLIDRVGVDRLYLPPVALQQLAQVAANHEAGCSSLCEVITAGEQLRITPAITTFFDRLGACRLHNHYGPSESHVVTAEPLGTATAEWARLPSIGRPIANARTYVLDPSLQRVPIGVPGELYIGGMSLARGYLDQPGLTAERFLPDPFAEEPGAVMYKTGDITRFLSDGRLAFLGRVDDQVKVRGYRIELGDVEAVLNAHPQLARVAAAVRSPSAGHSHLVAWVVPRENQVPNSAELRKFLLERLPEYMVPAIFNVVETIPLTRSGKIDRRALPEPRAASDLSSDRLVGPRDPVEFQLAQIWSDLLGVQRVGVNDSFFELGGHSLLAASLMTLIRQQFGKSLPLSALFQGPTIATLASLIRAETADQAWSPLVTIRARGSRRPLFCIHPGSGNVLCYAALSRHLGSDQPVYGLQSFGLQPDQDPLDNIEDMAARYIEALRGVQAVGPYYLAGWSLGGVVAFEMAQQLAQQGEDVASLVLIDSYAPVESAPPDVAAQSAADTSEFIGDSGEDESRWLASFAEDLRGLLGQDASGSPEDDHEPAVADGLLDLASETHFLPPESNGRQLERLTHVFRTNVRAMDRYLPRMYPGRLTLFRVTDQGTESVPDPFLGWENHAAGGVEVQTVPGDHYSVIRDPHVARLATKLGQCLS